MCLVNFVSLQKMTILTIKSNIFVLDEPGTALDAENMEGFVRILDLVTGYFDVTLLITHIESLKDVVDKTIEISKTEEGSGVGEEQG